MVDNKPPRMDIMPRYRITSRSQIVSLSLYGNLMSFLCFTSFLARNMAKPDIRNRANMVKWNIKGEPVYIFRLVMYDPIQSQSTALLSLVVSTLSGWHSE